VAMAQWTRCGIGVRFRPRLPHSRLRNTC
jgi:hypothetical protein